MTTKTAKIYHETGFMAHEGEVFDAPKLAAHQYAYAVMPSSSGYRVLFCTARKTGSYEHLSFCDAPKSFANQDAARAYASEQAAACRYGI